MSEQAYKNIDDVLWKQADCSSDRDYAEQSSWLLFLNYQDDLEQDKSAEAALKGEKYTYIINPDYRWRSGGASKGQNGKRDHNKSMTGNDFISFVIAKLPPSQQNSRRIGKTA